MIERAYRALSVSVADHVATLTLNRPERKNALSPELVNELIWAFDDANESPDVRVIVLTGAGSAFCAGADLKQMSGGGDDGPKLESKGDFADLLLRFYGRQKPVVAKVNGVAMGGALGLIACSDFAIAKQSVQLGTPEIHRGLFPMMIMAVLAEVVPRRHLLRMMLLGEKLSAETAKEMQLLSDVAADDEFEEAADKLIGQLAKQSPTAMRMGLAAYERQRHMTTAEAVPMLRGELFKMLGTKDAQEGLMAFMQKREPVWTGK